MKIIVWYLKCVKVGRNKKQKSVCLLFYLFPQFGKSSSGFKFYSSWYQFCCTEMCHCKSSSLSYVKIFPSPWISFIVLTQCNLYISEFFFPKKIAFDVSEFVLPLFKVSWRMCHDPPLLLLFTRKRITIRWFSSSPEHRPWIFLLAWPASSQLFVYVLIFTSPGVYKEL